MPRPARKQEENTTYHIWTRCIEWRALMKKDHFKHLLVETIIQTQEFYSFELVAYQVMDNHLHLVVRTVPGGAPISRIMQYLKARFAEKYNRKTGRIGPFWNERYRDSVVEDAVLPDIYLLWLLWYLAFNPVRKGLVGDPRKSPFGSILSYLDENHRDPVKITHHKFFLALGATFAERLKKFLYFEDAYRRRLSVIWAW